MFEGTFTLLSTIYEKSTLNDLLENLMGWYMNHQLLFWALVLLGPMAMTLLNFLMVYTLILYFSAYKYYYKIIGYPSTPWEGARHAFARFFDRHGRIFHGYEIEGLENIPDEGPALIIFFHGTLPNDVCYFLAKCQLQKNRMIRGVADKFLFKLPGFQNFFEGMQIIAGSPDTCADILLQGNLLLISPGGLRECLFSDESYQLIWGKRVGFARTALKGKAPIIPVFTKNIQQAYFTPRLARKYLRGLYERTRSPVVPICGGFPVKLRTIVDKAIPYEPDITPEELAKLVYTRLEALIARHQQIPGSIRQGLLERIPYFSKSKLT